MKRFISLILSVLILAALPLYSFAADGFSDRTEADDFYLLMESERSEGRLVLRVYLYNNPGVEGATVRVYHNKDAVTPVSYENGSVWSDGDYLTEDFVIIDPDKDYFSVSTGPISVANTNEGLYFTAVYDVIDEDADANIRIIMEKKPFVATGSDGKITDFVPSVINLVENKHEWVFDRVVQEAGIEQSGTEAYVCSVCGMEKLSETAPLPRWQKGDLDNNGIVGTKDVFLLKRYLIGYAPEEYEKQFCDAADVNGDGSYNEKDINLLHRMIMGEES